MASGVSSSPSKSQSKGPAEHAVFDWPPVGTSRRHRLHRRSRAHRGRYRRVVRPSRLLAGLTAWSDTGAANVVFDGIDMLLNSLPDERLERQELARLDDWIRESQVPLSSPSSLSGSASAISSARPSAVHHRLRRRPGEHVRRNDSSRNLRVVKYRGSGFAANPFPSSSAEPASTSSRSRPSALNTPPSRIACPPGSCAWMACSAAVICVAAASSFGQPGHGENKHKRQLRGGGLPARRGGLVHQLRRKRGADHRQHAVDRPRPGALPQRRHGTLIASLLSRGRSPEEHFVEIRDLIASHAPTCVVIDPLSSLLRLRLPVHRHHLGMYRRSREGPRHHAPLHIAPGRGQRRPGTLGKQDLDHRRYWMHVSYVAHDGERNRALTIIKSRGTGTPTRSANSSSVRVASIWSTSTSPKDQVLMGSARARRKLTPTPAHVRPGRL